jgi:hypothetical protein
MGGTSLAFVNGKRTDEIHYSEMGIKNLYELELRMRKWKADAIPWRE